MSLIETNHLQGDFTIFGFSRDPNFVRNHLFNRLGISPETISIGSIGQFFFYTTYADVAESEEAVVLKFGFLRSKTKSALNARQLLEQKLVSPYSINVDAFSGNGLVVALSKTDPVFSVFQTLLALPQLYYSELEDGILFSDVLRCIVSLIPQRELNEANIIHHFLFHNACGSLTYFKGIERLMPGYYLKWVDRKMESRLVRSLNIISEEAQFLRDDIRAMTLLSESMDDIIGDYTAQIQSKGQGFINQLSGGVDSTLTQYYLKEKSNLLPLRSISYIIQVPSFDYEIEYAKQASQLLHTEHTFVNYSPQDYPGFLTHVIDMLAQPPTHETEMSLIAIAEYVRGVNWPERYFFTGHGSDSLFGFSEARKLKVLKLIGSTPFADVWLRGLGSVLVPFTAISQILLKGSEILASKNNPDALVSRENSILTYEVDWEIIRRCFGNQAMNEALAYRRNFTSHYTKSSHYLDKVHLLELITFTYDLAVKNQQLAHAYRMEQIFPFFDEDFVNMALTIHPDIRYIKGFRYKHLMRRLLELKVRAPVAKKRKGDSTVFEDLVAWMRSGPLKPLVDDIRRPDFMNKVDFEHMIQTPNYFLFGLLTFDIFQKRIFGKV